MKTIQKLMFHALLVAPLALSGYPSLAHAQDATTTDATTEAPIEITQVVDEKSEALLKAMTKKMTDAASVSVSVGIVYSATVQGQDMREERSFQLAATRPNLYFRQTSNGDVVEDIRIADGTNVSHYIKELSAYTVDESPATFDELFENDPIGRASILGTLLMSSNYDELLGEYTTVSYVGTTEEGTTTLDRISMKSNEQDVEVLLSKDEQPNLMGTTIVVTDPGRPVITIKISFADWSFEPVPAEKFVFVAPEGSKKVNSFQEAADSRPEPSAELIGKAAPEFALPGLVDEKPITLASHKDKDIVVLDFWATWCPPCRKGLPDLAKITEKYKDKNVVVYAVNVREESEVINTFLEAQKLKLNVLLDAEGTTGDAYQVTGIPQTVIIDKAGVVQAVHVGLPNDMEQVLSGQIDALIAGKSLLPTEAAE